MIDRHHEDGHVLLVDLVQDPERPTASRVQAFQGRAQGLTDALRRGGQVSADELDAGSGNGLR